MNWNFDEKKTIIGNKKFNLKGRYFEVPQSLKNQNPSLQKAPVSENISELNILTPLKIDCENNINLEKVISSINNKPMHKERKEFLQILSEHEDKGKVTGVHFKRRERESAWSEPYQPLENKNKYDYNAISSSGIISEEEVFSHQSEREDLLIGKKRKNSSPLEFPSRQVINENFSTSGIEVDFSPNNFSETTNLNNNYDGLMSSGFSYSNTNNIKQKKIPTDFMIKPGGLPKYSPMTMNFQNNLNNTLYPQGTQPSLDIWHAYDEYEKISDDEEGEVQNLEISIKKNVVPISQGTQPIQPTPIFNPQLMTNNMLNNVVPPFYHHLPPYAQPLVASLGSTTYPIQSINMIQNINSNKFVTPFVPNVSTSDVSLMKRDECRNFSKNIPSASILRQEVQRLERQKKLSEASKNKPSLVEKGDNSDNNSSSSPVEFLNINATNFPPIEKNKNDRNLNFLYEKKSELEVEIIDNFNSGSNILKKECAMEKNKPFNFDFKSSENKLNALFNTQKKIETFSILYKYKLITNYISIISKTFEKNTLNFEHFFTNQDLTQFGYINDLKITAQLEAFDTETHDETKNFFANLENEKVGVSTDGNFIQLLIHSKNRHMLSIFNVDSQVEEKKNLFVIITIYEKIIADKINKFLTDSRNAEVIEKSQSEQVNKLQSEIIYKSQFENSINDLKFKSQSPNSSMNLSSEKDSKNMKKTEKKNIAVQTQSLSDLVNTDEVVVKSYEIEELRKLKLEFHQELDKQIKKKSEEIKQMYNIQFDILKKESADIKAKLTEKERLSTSLNKEINELRNNKENLEKNLLTLNSSLKSVMEEKDKMDQEFHNEKFSSSEKHKKINSLKQNIKELKMKCDELEKFEKNHIKLQNQLNLQIEELTQKSEELLKENLVLKMVPKEIPVSVIKGPNNVDGFIIQEFTEEEEVKSTDVMLKQLAEDFLCIICGEKMRNYVNEECRHLIYCHGCLIKTINSQPGVKKMISKNDDKNIIKIKQAINCPTCRVQNFTFKKVIVS
jgi:hypothetical protein